MMTRRHFTLLAEILGAQAARVATDGTKVLGIDVLEDIATDIKRMLCRENPRFDPARFDAHVAKVKAAIRKDRHLLEDTCSTT